MCYQYPKCGLQKCLFDSMKFLAMLHKMSWNYLEGPQNVPTFLRANAATANGKKVVAIDARYNSRTCSKCGFQKKENRNGRTFTCKSCGFQIDADLNASRNIATFSRSDRSRLPVNQPIVAG